MIKELYKQKGWTATSAIVRHNCVEVKLAIDHRYNFCCSWCRAILKTHSVREICVRDLPIADKDVMLDVDTMQAFLFSSTNWLYKKASMSTLLFVSHMKQQEVAERGRIRRITVGLVYCATLCGEGYDTKSEKR